MTKQTISVYLIWYQRQLSVRKDFSLVYGQPVCAVKGSLYLLKPLVLCNSQYITNVLSNCTCKRQRKYVKVITIKKFQPEGKKQASKEANYPPPFCSTLCVCLLSKSLRHSYNLNNFLEQIFSWDVHKCSASHEILSYSLNLTNFLEQIFFWDVHNYSPSHEILCLYRNRRFMNI
jgi:hypothetical protein